MSWTDKKDYYQTFARQIEPHAVLMTTDSWLGKTAAVLSVIVSLGMLKYRDFIDRMAFAAGPILCFPKRLNELNLATVVHECQHAKQCRYFGLGISPWVGLIPFLIAYIFLIFPIYFAPFRYLLELNADKAAWKYRLENSHPPNDVLKDALHFGETVAGKVYIWPWPKKWVMKGFKRSVMAMIQGK